MARTCRSVNPATPVLLVTQVPCEVRAHYQLITHIMTHKTTEFINDLKSLIKAKHQIFTYSFTFQLSLQGIHRERYISFYYVFLHTMSKLKIQVLWDMPPCMLVKKLQKFEEVQCLQHQGFSSSRTVSEQNSSILLYDTDHEDWGNSSSKMLLTIYHSTWSQIPKQSSLIWLWQPQNSQRRNCYSWMAVNAIVQLLLLEFLNLCHEGTNWCAWGYDGK
jgi:hypothetical protein